MRLQFAHCVNFILWHECRAHFINTHQASHCLGNGFVVASEHDDRLDSQCVQFSDRLGSFWARAINQPDGSKELSICGNQHHCARFRLE